MSAVGSTAGSATVRLLGRRRLVHWRRAHRRAFTLAGRRRLIAMAAFAFYLSTALDAAAARWSVVYDPQSSRCLEGVIALVIDKRDHVIDYGDIYAFEPPYEASLFFPPGMLFAKRVMGFPGDVVDVTLEATTVNGEVVAGPLGLLEMMGISGERYVRRFVVPPGHLLMLGDTLDSYDGRYWGTVPMANGVGQARVIF